MVFGIFLFSFLIFSIILSIPFVVYLNEQQKEIKRTIEAFKAGSIFKEIRDIEKEIQDFNQKLISFQDNQNNALNLSFFLAEILEQKPDSLKIETISFGNSNKIPRITIRGRSPSRSEFLKFVAALNGISSIKNVYSPIANILREKDFEFNLVAEFK